MNKKTKPVGKDYVNNEKLYEVMLAYKQALIQNEIDGKPKPKIPDYAGESIMLIANNMIKMLNNRGSPAFLDYTFTDEMISDGIENCLGGENKILTMEYGPIPIKDIVGKTVTVKTKDGIWRPALVKSYGKQMLYEYHFGKKNKKLQNVIQKVTATKNHRWFLQSRLNKRKMLTHQKCVVDDLRIGDRLDNALNLEEMDKNAIIHGIVYGDGSEHKKVVYNDIITHIQGKYSTLRVCKQDSVGEEINNLMCESGYIPKYPPHTKGDAIYYLGKKPYIKDLPFCNDPSYISGFIYGWWLADGTKSLKNANVWSISTINEDAVAWVLDYASYGGYHVLGIRKTEHSKGKYPNSKPLYTINLAKSENYQPSLKRIIEMGIQEVYCLEEPITHSFVLANGLLTGNCLMYFDNFDPFKYKKPFAYFSQIIYYAFLRRIDKEKKEIYFKYKTALNYGLFNADTMPNSDSESSSFEMFDNLVEFIQKFEKRQKEKSQKQKDKIKLKKEIALNVNTNICSSNSGNSHSFAMIYDILLPNNMTLSISTGEMDVFCKAHKINWASLKKEKKVKGYIIISKKPYMDDIIYNV
jgi:hypothetical protein